MNNEIKTVLMNLRVTPEFKKHVQDFASFFGSSVSEMMLFGITLSATHFYDELIKHMKGVEVDMKKGAQKEKMRSGIEELKKDRQYFLDTLRELPKKPKIFSDAEAGLSVESVMQNATA